MIITGDMTCIGKEDAFGSQRFAWMVKILVCVRPPAVLRLCIYCVFNTH